jgi:ubiquinone/menaquinone biosynthesis C-methylase UbiE
METPGTADDKASVAAIYEQALIAGTYLEKRLRFSWQRLLHDRQVELLNSIIEKSPPAQVLEVAPGPARLATDLRGVIRGVMVENSPEMIAIAKDRLRAAGLADTWEVRQGDAFALRQELSENSMDLAYSFRLIRHFRAEDRQRLYGELHRCLRKRGLLVFDVVNETTRRCVEARQSSRPAGEIAIYDAGYSQDSFRAEMEASGFDVLEMRPVLKHFRLQALASYKGDDVAPRVVATLIRVLEALPSSGCLEWIAVCRKV